MKQPNISRTEGFRFDMHLHSRYSSDSSIPVSAIVRCYRRSGILPLVCDHNRIAGSEQVYAGIRAINPEVPAILAEEIMTSEGEIVGLFLSDEIPPFLSAEETLDRIADQGALSLVPHPFCRYRSGALRAEILDRVIDRVTILEGFNGRVIDEQDNLAARRYAARHGLPVSAGSDAHTCCELGRTWVTLPEFLTPRELVRSLPYAEVTYRHAHPSVHTLTRFVKAARKIGLLSPA